MAREDAVSQAIGAALDVLSHRPSALISDIDGTLSRIVARPEEATVSEAARVALSLLAAHVDLVAVITGREEAVARSMVGVESITYVGNYALGPQTALPSADAGMLAAKQAAALLLPEQPCIEYEDKGIGFSLHYRACEHPEPVRHWLLETMSPIAMAHGGRLVEGKKVVEMVPAALPTKDAALRSLAEAHELNGIIFLGDDVSDVAVFNELKRRVADGLPSLSIGVIDGETDPLVQAAADVTLPGVASVEEFLSALAQALTAETSK